MDNSACAHIKVMYDPIKNKDGSFRERWICPDCAKLFLPVVGDVDYSKKVTPMKPPLNNEKCVAEILDCKCHCENPKGCDSPNQHRLQECEHCKPSPKESNWEDGLENLAAINYNLYLAGTVERKDTGEQWSYEQALEEIKSFISQTLASEKQRLVEDIEKFKVELNNPMGDDILNDVISLINSK